VRTVVKFMGALGAFGVATGLIYWLTTGERAGTVLLVAFGLMPLIVIAWILTRAAAADAATRAADDPDATPSDASGEVLGSFPTASLWPIFLVLGAVVAGAGLVYGLLLVPIGIGIGGVAVLGLMRESRA
jgi:Cytochrome c oxidase subunit IV